MCYVDVGLLWVEVLDVFELLLLVVFGGLFSVYDDV